MPDIILTCICGEQFTFTEGEQKFYAERGYQQPKRCLKCRRLKHQQSPQRQTFGEPAKGFEPAQPVKRDWKRDRKRNFDDYPQEDY